MTSAKFSKATRKGMQRTSLTLSEPVHTAVRVVATQRRTTLNAIVTELITREIVPEYNAMMRTPPRAARAVT